MPSIDRRRFHAAGALHVRHFKFEADHGDVTLAPTSAASISHFNFCVYREASNCLALSGMLVVHQGTRLAIELHLHTFSVGVWLFVFVLQTLFLLAGWLAHSEVGVVPACRDELVPRSTLFKLNSDPNVSLFVGCMIGHMFDT